MSISPAIWLDGESCTALPLPDRGLDFGDGLFETLLLCEGRPLYPELHWQRLEQGLGRLDFPDVSTIAHAYVERVSGEIQGWHWPWAALRLTVTRGEGPRGYLPPAVQQPRILITATALDRDCRQIMAPANLSVSSVRWSTQPLLAGIKHLNRLEQVMAARQSAAQGADDSLMLDESGRVISATAGNLFIHAAGGLLTPRLDRCGIAGTRRRLLLERWAEHCGLEAREAELVLDDVLAAEEVFVSNSLVSLRPVARIGDMSWSRHAICEALFDCYRREIT